MKPLFLAILLAASPALAGERGAEFFTTWDLDSDGQVTLSEVQTHRADIFAMFDADSNGTIAGEEFALIREHQLFEAENGKGPLAKHGKGMQAAAGQSMQQFDANGDGAVALAEFVDASGAWFTQRDRNDDGAITSADFGR